MSTSRQAVARLLRRAAHRLDPPPRRPLINPYINTSSTSTTPITWTVTS